MRNAIVFTLLSLSGPAVFAGAAVTFHGRILDASDRPINSGSVTFKIQVRSPGVPNCLLYEETRSVVMAESDGVFVIPIGDGNGQRSSSDPGITIENVFSNDPSKNFVSLTCNSGSTYQPAALDSRRLIVSFNDGTGAGDQMLPAIDVNYVPFALHAEEASSALKLGATPASRVMTVASGSAAPLSAANFSELMLLVNGNSSSYVKTSALPSCGAGEVLKAMSGALVCVTDDVGSDSDLLAGISCPDGKILKRVSGSWACGDESGVGSENDPTVKAYAKEDPGTGLKVASSHIAVDFGTGAGQVVEGNDPRLTDSRAPNGAATGDLSGSYPNPSVKAIRGNNVATTTPLNGQIYQWVNGATEWQPRFISFADLKKADGTAQMPATCAANETLAWSAITDVFTCAAIGSLDASKITTGTLAAARLPADTMILTCADGKIAKRVAGAWACADENAVASDLNNVVSTGIVQRTGAGAFSTLGVSAPVTNSGTSIGLAVGSGLTLNSGNLVPDFGSASGKVAQGNDSRFPSSTCTSGNYNRWDGTAWVCDADASGGTPSGTDGMIQFNNNGSFGSSGNLRWDSANFRLGLGVVPAYIFDAYSGTAVDVIRARSSNAAGTGLILDGSFGTTGGSKWHLYSTANGASQGGGRFVVYDETNTASRLTIDSTGNMGVGTTSPSQKLEVAGNVKISGSGNGITFPDGTSMTTAATGSSSTLMSSYPDVIYCDNGSGSNFYLYHSASDSGGANRQYNSVGWSYYLKVNATTGAYVASNLSGFGCDSKSISQLYSAGLAFNTVGGGGTLWTAAGSNISFGGGNVGIGTSSSTITADGAGTTALHVVTANDFVGSFEGGSNSYAGFDVNATGSGVPFIQLNRGTNRIFSLTAETDNNTINFRGGNAAAAPIMTMLKNTGNVGIGTTSPASTLVVSNASGPTEIHIDDTSATNAVLRLTGDSGEAVMRLTTVSTPVFTFGTTTNHPVYLMANNTTQMTILENGNVGIGTTSPGRKLSVAGVIESTSGGVKFPDGSTQTTAYTGGAPSFNLYGAAHTSAQCETAGGFVRSIGSGSYLCQFTGTSCPGGWTRNSNWGITHPFTCDGPWNTYQNYQCGSCVTASHEFSNGTQETCTGYTYDSTWGTCNAYTCTATLKAVGCY